MGPWFDDGRGQEALSHHEVVSDVRIGVEAEEAAKNA